VPGTDEDEIAVARGIDGRLNGLTLRDLDRHRAATVSVTPSLLAVPSALLTSTCPPVGGAQRR
jgi:hypothetical protein